MDTLNLVLLGALLGLEDKSYRLSSSVLILKLLLLPFYMQLFDHDNVVNKMASEFIFTTEGHIVRLDRLFKVNIKSNLKADLTKVDFYSTSSFSSFRNQTATVSNKDLIHSNSSVTVMWV